MQESNEQQYWFINIYYWDQIWHRLVPQQVIGYEGIKAIMGYLSEMTMGEDIQKIQYV